MMTKRLKRQIRSFYSLCNDWKEVVSEWQTAEQVIIPILREIGWPDAQCEAQDITLIRTGASKDFDLLYIDRSSKKIYMGIECKRIGTKRSNKKKVASVADKKTSPSNDSHSEQIIRYRTESNFVTEHDFIFAEKAKLVWTNGEDWIVFKDAALNRPNGQQKRQEISNLFAKGKGDHYGDYFTAFRFPKKEEKTWDEQFAKLSDELEPGKLLPRRNNDNNTRS